jgi:hypothetical protein
VLDKAGNLAIQLPKLGNNIRELEFVGEKNNVFALILFYVIWIDSA